MKRVAVVVVGALLAVNCATNQDRGKRTYFNEPRMKVEEVPVKGFEVTVTRHAGADVDGELLAVDDAFLWLERAPGKPFKIARSTVKSVKTESYGGEAAVFGAWTVAGALSTLTHGFLLVITAPLWLCVGGTTTVLAAVDNDVEIDAKHLDLLKQYARYPQGMPGTLPEPPAPPPASPPAELAPPLDGGTLDAGPPDAAPSTTTPDAGPMVDAGASAP